MGWSWRLRPDTELSPHHRKHRVRRVDSIILYIVSAVNRIPSDIGASGTLCWCKYPALTVSATLPLETFQRPTGPSSERAVNSNTISMGDFVRSLGGGSTRVGPGILDDCLRLWHSIESLGESQGAYEVMEGPRIHCEASLHNLTPKIAKEWSSWITVRS